MREAGWIRRCRVRRSSSAFRRREGKKTEQMRGKEGAARFGRKEGEEDVLVEGVRRRRRLPWWRQAYQDGGRSGVRAEEENEKIRGGGVRRRS